MFSKTALFISTLVAVSSAASIAARTEPGSCNTGPIQCCQSTEAASGPNASKLLGLLGVVVQDLNVLVGLQCSPITVIGGGTSGCNAEPVCCQNNTFHGLIAIGCVPINIG
ncbi:fungal hydrophobin [Pterulicium gracile]|uniref:Hydrophobin n=1 Tax=Pterulicium gracile TaxID=1884261 RepID=A0A5C3QG83_9AGAR|nr:fungal hydrophobin [Pterula gracilis]TFK99168.1 fungal hydrophobin [Pterula gracilis]